MVLCCWDRNSSFARRKHFVICVLLLCSCSEQEEAVHRCCESVCHTRHSGGVKASYANGGEVYLVCGVVLFYSKYVGCSYTPNCCSNAQNFLYRLYCLDTLFRLAAELPIRKSGGCATTHGSEGSGLCQWVDHSTG